MYIVIEEDGRVNYLDEESLTDSVRKECSDGLIQVIDISDSDDPKELYEGTKWGVLEHRPNYEELNK